jgi:hypothetical protein
MTTIDTVTAKDQAASAAYAEKLVRSLSQMVNVRIQGALTALAMTLVATSTDPHAPIPTVQAARYAAQRCLGIPTPSADDARTPDKGEVPWCRTRRR